MEIVQRAQSRLGPLTYGILWSNCEHFASWCRYGSKLSKQVYIYICIYNGCDIGDKDPVILI